MRVSLFSINLILIEKNRLTLKIRKFEFNLVKKKDTIGVCIEFYFLFALNRSFACFPNFFFKRLLNFV